jgi:VIT1/CCC1 family predicted Fe2+/Mn2+ transporter
VTHARPVRKNAVRLLLKYLIAEERGSWRAPRSLRTIKVAPGLAHRRSAGIKGAPGGTETVTAGLTRDPDRWVDFMMRFELGLEEPDAGRALKSAFTIGGAYVGGGLIPLAPYFLRDAVSRALPVSIALTLEALLIFGGVKGQLTGVAPLRTALQTAIVGSLAAAAAFAIARLASR